ARPAHRRRHRGLLGGAGDPEPVAGRGRRGHRGGLGVVLLGGVPHRTDRRSPSGTADRLAVRGAGLAPGRDPRPGTARLAVPTPAGRGRAPRTLRPARRRGTRLAGAHIGWLTSMSAAATM